MIDIKKEQELFEKVFKEFYDCENNADIWLSKTPIGNYIVASTESHFEFWKARAMIADKEKGND